MKKRHENYKHLIWTLAKTDFKLRYHGSVLGYVWALLKPLLLFLILNFVFSSLFNPRNTGTEYYSLQLLVGLMLFFFFSEGTNAGLSSLMSKASLVTKIYVPRWTIILASTLNSLLVFLMNLVIITAFFIWYGFWPGIGSILVFLFFIILTYIVILAFSFAAAPLYLKFRDLSQIWEVGVAAMFYASPIIYPLTILPEKYHQLILLNPIAFIIHFTKLALTQNHWPTFGQSAVFAVSVILSFFIGVLIYKKMEKKIAENI